jgi:DNA processing protein
MNWNSNLILEKAKNKGIERELFPESSPDETLIVEALKERDLHVNEIAIRTNLPIGTINSTLFMLEMNGVVISMAGGSYHLLS